MTEAFTRGFSLCLTWAVCLLACGGAPVAAAPGVVGRWDWRPAARDFAPITNERYRTECGGCHFAYPPGMLPADAWQRIMAALADHFGDDASPIGPSRLCSGQVFAVLRRSPAPGRGLSLGP